MNENLVDVLGVGMRNDLVNFIALHFLMNQFEVINNVDIAIVYADANHRDSPNIVSDENSIGVVKGQAIRVPFFEQGLIVFG